MSPGLLTAEEQRPKSRNCRGVALTIAFSLSFSIGALSTACGGININKLTQLADQGDTESAYRLGRAYLAGNAVERDYSSAKLWLSRAARQGHPCAATFVGLVYDNGGFGVEKDGAMALEWYTRGTESHDQNAHIALGLAELYQESGEPDYANVAEWLNAGLGEPEAGGCYARGWRKARALFLLGMMYYEGRGVSKEDKTYALSLLDQARQEQEYETYETRILGDTEFRETTTHTPALDARWIISAATDQGFSLAYALLGGMYAEGSNGVKKDPYEAYIWYWMATRSGNFEFLGEALRLLGELAPGELQKAQSEAASRRRSFEK